MTEVVAHSREGAHGDDWRARPPMLMASGRERFVSFPYGPDKEEELKAFPTAAAALDDAGSTLPADAVKRGDSSPVALDNEIGMAMGGS